MQYKEWLDEWLETYVKPTSKIRTYERYQINVNMHIKRGLGEYELNELTPIIIQRYITQLLNKGNSKTGEGLSVNSVNGIITIIKSTLKLAYELGLTKEYIGERIKRPKMQVKTVECFTLVEQKKIEQAVLNSKKEKLFGIVLCLYTGLRIGELLALEWTDIDFSKGILYVNKTCYDGKDKGGNFCRITDTPKTSSSKREIPLPKQLKLNQILIIVLLGFVLGVSISAAAKQLKSVRIRLLIPIRRTAVITGMRQLAIVRT